MSDPEEVGDGWGDELDDLPEAVPTDLHAELQQLRGRLEESEELRSKERQELQSRLQEVMQKAKDRIMEMQARMNEMQETLQERDQQLDRLQAAGPSSSEVSEPTSEAPNAVEAALREELEQCRGEMARLREEAESRLSQVVQQSKEKLREEFKSRLAAVEEKDKMGVELAQCQAELEQLRQESETRKEEAERHAEASEKLEQCQAELERLRQESETRKGEDERHADASEELAQCQAELQRLRQESGTRKEEAERHAEASEKLAQCQAELERLRQESETRKGEEDLRAEASEELAQCQAELQRLRQESETRKEEAERHAEVRQELTRCQAELEQLRQESETRRADLAQKSAELEDSQAELARLRAGAARTADEDAAPEENVELAECRAELAQLREESESRLSDVVRKSKEHLLSLQTRLEAASAENAELCEKLKEAEEGQQQQQEKLAKMRQLVAKANDRITESESREKALSESLSKAQSQRLALQEQIGSLEKNASVPPSREEIEQRGGILLAVETDNDDVWCLVSTGLCPDESATAVEEVPSIQKRVRWWLLSQLDVAERPVPMQRRWKGEVSALRAQMQRFKKRAEELQEEYDAYKDKANAALQNSALQSQELQLKERQAEHQGEQLQGMALEMQRMQADKARMSDEVHEMRRQLREADARRADLERALERKVREADERGKAEIQSCRTSLESKMDEMERGWRERERALRQDLDLRRGQKEALEEEVSSLRSLLESHAAAAAAKAAESAAAEARAAEAAAKEKAEGEKVHSPVAELPSMLSSDMSVAEPQPPVARSDSTASAMTTPAAESTLPPQAYSLHTSVAWQDLVNLRSQVRQLEAQMKEEQERHLSSLQESERGRKQLQNFIDEHRLEQTVGQHQQMEYIRNVFRKFVEILPANSAETEQLVQVLMTFFQFSSEDAAAIQAKRGSARKPGLWRLF